MKLISLLTNLKEKLYQPCVESEESILKNTQFAARKFLAEFDFEHDTHSVVENCLLLFYCIISLNVPFCKVLSKDEGRTLTIFTEVIKNRETRSLTNSYMLHFSLNTILL